METIKNKKGKIISYREKVYMDRKPVTKTFKRKTDAIAWKRQKQAEYQKLKALGVSLISSSSFKNFLLTWLDKKGRQNLSPSTMKSYSGIVFNDFIPILGSLKLTNIRLEHVDHLIAYLMDKDLSPTRINYVLSRFKMILSDAVKWDYLVKNPLLNLQLLKVDPKDKEYWLKFEVIRFLEANRFDENYSLYLVALNTGLRRGELLGLCWDCVDFSRQKIIVKRQRNRDGLIDGTKSRRSREIQVNQSVTKELKKLQESGRSTEYVFTKRDGSLHDPTHFSTRVFSKAVTKAEVKKIRFHDLRTTFACNWCIEGEDIFALSKVLGHSRIDTTIRNYADLHPTYMAKVCENLQFSLEDSPNLAHGHLQLVDNEMISEA